MKRLSKIGTKTPFSVIYLCFKKKQPKSTIRYKPDYRTFKSSSRRLRLKSRKKTNQLIIIAVKVIFRKIIQKLAFIKDKKRKIKGSIYKKQRKLTKIKACHKEILKLIVSCFH